jgi:DNA-binding transcriptional ArsR family regulator
MFTTIDDLVESIDGRIRELNGEIASLQDARKALGSNGSFGRTATATAKRRTARPKGKGRVSAIEVLESIQQGGDQVAVIARDLNAPVEVVRQHLRALEEAGQVRRSGQRRGTRWNAITDEDRIQERATELASRSKRGK